MNEKAPSKKVIKIVLSVVLFVLVFLLNRFVFPKNDVSGLFISIVCVLAGVYFLLQGIAPEKKKLLTKEEIGSKILAKWTFDDFCLYLAHEDMLDIVIDNGDHLHIKISSDERTHYKFYESHTYTVYYHIEDVEYTDFAKFKTDLREILNSDEVSILYIGFADNPLDIDGVNNDLLRLKGKER